MTLGTATRWCVAHAVRARLFPHDPQADEIVLGPKGLCLDHRFEGLNGEGVPSLVRRHRDASAVVVSVALMRSFLADEIESVAGEGGDHLSGCKRTDAAVVDAHALDGDGNTGLLLGNLFDLHRIERTFGQCFPVLDEFLDDHADNFIDAAQGFFFGAA